MATVATISVSSDIAPGFGGINESMTLTQGGNLIDIDSTTGFAIRKLSATGAAVLVDMSQELIETKGVVDKSVGVTVLIASEPIGKLYGGDWMMMPLTGVDAGDVSINPATDDTVVIEYVMFFEEN